MPEDEIERALGSLEPDPPEPFEVWAENVAALEIFLSLSTQWRAAAPGGPVTGFDYGGVRAVFWARGVRLRDRERLFGDVQVMERAAAAVFNAEGDDG